MEQLYYHLRIMSSIVIMLRLQISEVYCKLTIEAPIELNRTRVGVQTLMT